MYNHNIELIVVIVYMLFLIGIGLVFKRFNSNISDFFRGGCRGTWWLVGMSGFMAGISAYTFTGASGVAFKAGWSVANIYIGNTLALFLAFLFFAPWFRQLRAITGAEVVRMRFGAATQQFYAGLMILTSLLAGGIQLWAMGIFISSVFGFDIWIVILVIGGVVLFYSTSGGSWAVMATDFIQSLVMIPVTILVAVLCLIQVGGFSGLNAMIADAGLSSEFRIVNSPGEFPLEQFTLIWAMALIIKQGVFNNTMVGATRFFAVKDGREARKAALLGCILMGVGCIFWFLPPMVARLLYESEVMAMGAGLTDPTEAAYAVACFMVLPTGMTGIVVVAMFSATMSSLDTGLNRNAGLFVRDVYPALCRMFGKREMGDAGQLLLGRVFTLLFGVLIIGMALYFAIIGGRGMFAVMLTVGAMIGIPISVPMLFGLFFKKVTSWSAIFSVVCGVLPSLIAVFMGLDWNFQTKFFYNLSFGLAGFIGSTLFWHRMGPAYRKQVDAFFERMYRPVNFEEEVGQANDLSQLSIIGRFGTAVGCFIFLFLLLPNSMHGRIAIFSVAGIVVAIGCFMIYIGKKAEKKLAQAQ